MEVSKKENSIASWFVWHFYEMPKFLFSVWGNYLWFAFDFFSVPLLVKTFFSPWRRYSWKYPKGFYPGEFFGTLISNVFSRIIGAIARFFLIIIGILFEILVLVVGFISILFWILMPFIMIFLLFFSIYGI